MDYTNIILDVAKALDPDLVINVDLVSIESLDLVPLESLDDAHFVVADIHYPERDMRIPFIINSEDEVFMPYDWESSLPTKASDINSIKWVQFDFA